MTALYRFAGWHDQGEKDAVRTTHMDRFDKVRMRFPACARTENVHQSAPTRMTGTTISLRAKAVTNLPFTVIV